MRKKEKGGERRAHDGRSWLRASRWERSSRPVAMFLHRAIQFAVTKLFGTGSQVPLLLVIDAI
jgi:hypothetical protein